MKKGKTAFVLALVMVGAIAAGLIATVYAKYTSTITKTGTATVATWAFTTDNTSGTITCDPTQTYTAASLASGKIAPGTYGVCQISVSNAGSDVGVSYEVTPNPTNKPTNLKFYSDANHTQEISSSAPLTGTLAPHATATSADVYWYWPYEDSPSSTTTYDAADTADGTSGSTMTITIDITGTQVQPVAQ